jgi:hypothetical protein
MYVRMCVYIYTYIPTYICMYMYVNVYIYIHTYTHTHTHTHSHTCINMYTRARVHTHTCIYTHTNITRMIGRGSTRIVACFFMYTHTHTRTHAHTHTHTRHQNDRAGLHANGLMLFPQVRRKVINWTTAEKKSSALQKTASPQCLPLGDQLDMSTSRHPTVQEMFKPKP